MFLTLGTCTKRKCKAKLYAELTRSNKNIVLVWGQFTMNNKNTTNFLNSFFSKDETSKFHHTTMTSKSFIYIYFWVLYL